MITLRDNYPINNSSKQCQELMFQIIFKMTSCPVERA